MTVTGTTAPGNTVYVAATNTDANSATTVVSGGRRRRLVQHRRDGRGRDERPQHRRGQPERRHRAREADDPLRLRARDAAPRRRRPEQRRQRPGQLRVSDLGRLPRRRLRHPGIPGLRRGVRRRSSGCKTRDLSPTFGNPLGAQLVDVYVHVPGAATTSTAAANGSRRNFPIAPASAWSRLIQAQGFGQRFEDASGATVGTVDDQRELDLAVHHDQGVEGGSRRHARDRLGVHRRPHRPGRLQQRPGARLPADPAGLPVRRLRHGEQRPALHGRPGDRAEGDGRDHTGRRVDQSTSSTTRSGRSCWWASRSRSARRPSGLKRQTPAADVDRRMSTTVDNERSRPLDPQGLASRVAPFAGGAAHRVRVRQPAARRRLPESDHHCRCGFRGDRARRRRVALADPPELDAGLAAARVLPPRRRAHRRRRRLGLVVRAARARAGDLARAVRHARPAAGRDPRRSRRLPRPDRVARRRRTTRRRSGRRRRCG